MTATLTLNTKSHDESSKARSEARHHQKKKRIGNVALDLIAQKGVSNVSLRMVAKGSNYHPTSLYEYFQSKDDMLKYVSELAREEFMKYLDTVITQEKTAVDTLLELGMIYLDYAKEQPKHFQVMFISLKQDWANFDPTDDASPIKFLIQTIDEGVLKSELIVHPGQSVMDIAYHLWSVVHGMAILQQTFFLEYTYDWKSVHKDLIKRTIELYIE